jgi:hypothetical protein
MKKKFNNDGTVTLTITEEEYYNFIYKNFPLEKAPEENNRLTETLKAAREGFQNSLEIKVTDFLIEVGMPRHLKGFEYCRQAVLKVIQDRSYLSNIVTRLYTDIATENNDIITRVERAIRHAVGVAFSRIPEDVCSTIFGNSISTLKKKPTNAQFISAIADTIMLLDDAEAYETSGFMDKIKSFRK